MQLAFGKGRLAWEQRNNINLFGPIGREPAISSTLAMHGASVLEIATVLGHKTFHRYMVQRYAHLTEGHTAAVVGRMNRVIFE